MITSNYSGTKCPKCGKSNFELVEDTPDRSKFKYYYLRCSSYACHAFLQAMPFHHTNSLIDDAQTSIEGKINSMDSRTTHNIAAINQNLANGIGRVIELLSKDKP